MGAGVGVSRDRRAWVAILVIGVLGAAGVGLYAVKQWTTPRELTPADGVTWSPQVLSENEIQTWCQNYTTSPATTIDESMCTAGTYPVVPIPATEIDARDRVILALRRRLAEYERRDALDRVYRASLLREGLDARIEHQQP